MEFIKVELVLWVLPGEERLPLILLAFVVESVRRTN